MPMLVILLSVGLIVWVALGSVGAEFIINWNQRHLLGKEVSPRKLRVADLLIVNLSCYWGARTLTWRAVLIPFGPLTFIKAILLRLCGGPA